MNSFEEALAEAIGDANLRKLQGYMIGIAGAGGLGSNCAYNLLRSGFKHFVIADFDCIEFSNLNRQFYFFDQVGRNKVEALKENLLRINPDADVRICTEKLESHNITEIFAACDVIVEAFDQVKYKRMIVEQYLNSNKLLVAASGLAGWGQSDELRVEKIKDNFYIVGDFKTEVGQGIPPMSPRVNIAAAKQADVILEYVLKNEDILRG